MGDNKVYGKIFYLILVRFRVSLDQVLQLREIIWQFVVVLCSSHLDDRPTFTITVNLELYSKST